MWEGLEARLEENEQDRPIPLRRVLFDVLRNSGLRPGNGVTKKMLAFEFGQGERLLWEIQNPSNVFLHEKWRTLVEAAGFVCERRPYQIGMKDGGRHSALSRDWSFGDGDCFVVRIENAEALRRLITGCRSRADVENVMRHKVIPLLAEYFYEDWSKVAAVLGDGTNGSHFLEARRLAAPAGFTDDELGGDKLRWSVKASFDFSDFAA